MKRLMTFALVALLSLGVASVSLAQGQPAGGQAAGEATPKAGKKHKEHKKSGKKHKKTEAAEPAK